MGRRSKLRRRINGGGIEGPANLAVVSAIVLIYRQGRREILHWLNRFLEGKIEGRLEKRVSYWGTSAHERLKSFDHLRSGWLVYFWAESWPLGLVQQKSRSEILLSWSVRSGEWHETHLSFQIRWHRQLGDKRRFEFQRRNFDSRWKIARECRSLGGIDWNKNCRCDNVRSIKSQQFIVRSITAKDYPDTKIHSMANWWRR